MIHNRHPEVVGQLIAQLEGRPDTPVMRAASDAAHQLNGRVLLRPISTWAIVFFYFRPVLLRPGAT